MRCINPSKASSNEVHPAVSKSCWIQWIYELSRSIWNIPCFIQINITNCLAPARRPPPPHSSQLESTTKAHFLPPILHRNQERIILFVSDTLLAIQIVYILFKVILKTQRSSPSSRYHATYYLQHSLFQYFQFLGILNVYVQSHKVIYLNIFTNTSKKCGLNIYIA